MDKGLRNFIKFNQLTRQLSNDEIVQQYLSFIDEIAKNEVLPFLLEGNIQWRSQSTEGIKHNDIFLKSRLYDPVGKHILDNPVRNFLQTQMNHFEIGGTFDIDVDVKDLESAKGEVLRILNEITILKNSFSLIHGVSIEWNPARYLPLGIADNSPPSPELNKNKKSEYQFIRMPKSQENQISSIFKDEHVVGVLTFTDLIRKIDDRVKTILKTSMDWHADGNRFRSGLNRYVSFWTSIELLGEFFYKKLNA
ncbi:hypothetical protein KA005_77125, partial [bacterium]|nr:hypothetical protein [bacterium]